MQTRIQPKSVSRPESCNAPQQAKNSQPASAAQQATTLPQADRLLVEPSALGRQHGSRPAAGPQPSAPASTDSVWGNAIELVRPPCVLTDLEYPG